jgi:hypothetical protein
VTHVPQEEFTRQQLEVEARLDDDDYARRHEAARLVQAQAVRELEYAKKVRWRRAVAHFTQSSCPATDLRCPHPAVRAQLNAAIQTHVAHRIKDWLLTLTPEEQRQFSAAGQRWIEDPSPQVDREHMALYTKFKVVACLTNRDNRLSLTSQPTWVY